MELMTGIVFKMEELEKKLNNFDLSTLDVTGLSFNPFKKMEKIK